MRIPARLCTPSDGFARLRAAAGGPLVVEPFSADDLPAVRAHADGVLVGAAWMQDFRLISAAARVGLPVIVQRGHAATLEEWLSAAEYCAAEGNREVILCESGSRTHLADRSPDLLLLREAHRRSGLPVIVDLRGAPELAGAVVAAGADGLLLPEDATPEETVRVRELGRLLGPVLRAEEPADLPSARAAIDRVDTLLATLLERRAGLAGQVQPLKPVGGFAGRDPERERQVVEAMAARAQRLGTDRWGGSWPPSSRPGWRHPRTTGGTLRSRCAGDTNGLIRVIVTSGVSPPGLSVRAVRLAASPPRDPPPGRARGAPFILTGRGVTWGDPPHPGPAVARRRRTSPWPTRSCISMCIPSTRCSTARPG
ncbi:MAG: 3-deoxy-D-arabinoheptulosonate-7-phosphate synthase [Streptosporangiales bacterium]|nr:3-deoxy-D-arabinoheptulosonate-7-phosphate synthase [Streptosporangiales bacterium]